MCGWHLMLATLSIYTRIRCAHINSLLMAWDCRKIVCTFLFAANFGTSYFRFKNDKNKACTIRAPTGEDEACGSGTFWLIRHQRWRLSGVYTSKVCMPKVWVARTHDWLQNVAVFALLPNNNPKKNNWFRLSGEFGWCSQCLPFAVICRIRI